MGAVDSPSLVGLAEDTANARAFLRGLLSLAAQGDEAARKEALQWMREYRQNVLTLRAEGREHAKARASSNIISPDELARRMARIREEALAAETAAPDPVEAPDAEGVDLDARPVRDVNQASEEDVHVAVPPRRDVHMEADPPPPAPAPRPPAKRQLLVSSGGAAPAPPVTGQQHLDAGKPGYPGWVMVGGRMVRADCVGPMGGSALSGQELANVQSELAERTRRSQP